MNGTLASAVRGIQVVGVILSGYPANRAGLSGGEEARRDGRVCTHGVSPVTLFLNRAQLSQRLNAIWLAVKAAWQAEIATAKQALGR